ncbi:hypothetical protein NQZ68_028568 [Dissostichus eleginoides]|nr:hypothetical protein NQZ68_028568 [Dissostichus eleginoides]
MSPYIYYSLYTEQTPSISRLDAFQRERRSSIHQPMCFDWGESSDQGVSVLEGEVGWLSCPLFSHPSVYNYSSTQSAGHNLFWYRLPEGHDLEQPLAYSSRISRDGVRLWLQPSSAADTGLYICMLSYKEVKDRPMLLFLIKEEADQRPEEVNDPGDQTRFKIISFFKL